MRDLHHIKRAFFLCVLLVLTMPQSLKAVETSIYFDGLNVNLPVESFKERQFRGVIRQKYDYSCGSASLATLLYYHYDLDVGEQEVLESMYAIGDKKKIVREGFSLLDMKQYLASIGMKANGFKAPLEKLKNVGVPAIALINNNGFLHFIVVKGVSDDLVLVGDPALGKRVIDRKEFERMWNGILFVITSNKQVARSSFNRKSDWHVRETAAFDSALSNAALSSFTVHTSPTPNYFF